MIFKTDMARRSFWKLMMLVLFTFVSTVFLDGTSGWGADEQKGPVAQPAPVETGPQKIPFLRPDSHRGNWIEYHGRTVALTGNAADVSGKTCLVCHEKNDCVSCHNTRAPRDHTNFWRTRGHGLTAGANPERCMNCHRQDYCVRCHNETAPRTHVANWRQRHCTWCHFGSGVAPADNCVVCHKQAPHTSAPHPVSGTLNCSLCH
jgi:hypothetical protein